VASQRFPLNIIPHESPTKFTTVWRIHFEILTSAKAAAAPKKVTVKELTGTKMMRGQASGKKQLDKQAKRCRVKAFKTACLQYAEVREAGGS